MKYLLGILLMTLCLTPMNGQAGMYSESDLELQSLFIEAELAKVKGDFEKQIDLLKEVLRRDKTEHAAYYELAKVYFKQDNLEDAQKNILNAKKHGGDNEWYTLIAAQIFESSQQFNLAISQYQELIELNPKNASNYHKLAINQLSNNQAKEASNSLHKCLEIVGIEEETSRRLFDIYRDLGEDQKALDVLQELSDSSPKNVRYLNNLAGFLNELGQTKASQEVYHKILDIDLNNAKASMALVKKDAKIDEAGSYLRSLIPVMENQNIPLDNKIRELMPFISSMTPQGESTAALIEISESLVERYPNEAKVYAIQGDVLYYAQQFKASEKAYAKSISINDVQFVLWDQWMLNLWELDDHAKLKSVSLEAIDLFPNEVFAYIMHSLALSKLKDGEAKSYLDEATFIAANSHRYKYPISITQLWFGKNTSPLETIKSDVTKLKLDNLSKAIYFELLGDIYHSINQKDKAKSYWNHAVERGANPNRINKKNGV